MRSQRFITVNYARTRDLILHKNNNFKETINKFVFDIIQKKKILEKWNIHLFLVSLDIGFLATMCWCLIYNIWITVILTFSNAGVSGKMYPKRLKISLMFITFHDIWNSWCNMQPMILSCYCIIQISHQYCWMFIHFIK